MSGGASKLRDVRKLADARAILELDIPLAELPGLPVELISGDSVVHARLQFGREQGYMVAQVTLKAPLELICQRCMGPMPLTIESSSAALLIESEAEAEAVPVEWETYLAAEGRLSPAALAAEELLLALPVVPLHADAEACAGAAGRPTEARDSAPAVPAASVGEQATVRPFADLRALLDSGAKSKS
ncbi:MAG TPA: YceD family protein [Steroidobacteraceae bacterium]|jgi:uncharacterized protein